jgi:hypothetical protein
MHAREILLRQSCMHVALIARPWGVQMVTRIGNTLNRPCSGMGSMGRTTRRYYVIQVIQAGGAHKLRTTETQTKSAC